MKIFTCLDRFDDIMTCIYDAWECALKEGHDNVSFAREPIYQPSLFAEYIHVDADSEKVEKVVRSIKKGISLEAYVFVYYASLSCEPDAMRTIYDFLRIGFRVGGTVCNMLHEPSVIRMMELRRNVGREGQAFKEFARFTSLNNKVYVSHIEPKRNVITIVAKHFEDRMPSEHWMIIDDTRMMAVVHPKDEESYIRYLTQDEFEVLKQTEHTEDEYTELWRGFFKAISIKERESHQRQRNMIPIWMRKHAVEFMDRG